jgi:hypothetical protein
MATKIINWFVDRTKQCQFFLERMVSRATTKQILLVQAPTEMGKTWLIQKLRYECDARKIPVAQLDFRDGRAWDFLALVREVREQMGPEHFNELTSVINESTSIKLEVPAGANVGNVVLNVATQGGQVVNSDVKVGDIKVDNNFFIQANSPTIRQNIEARISENFITCVQRLAKDQVVVFLFDAYEEVMLKELDHWLRGNLFARLREGDLPKVVAVMAGRTVPEFDDTWGDCVAHTGLDSFDSEHVTEYLQRRGAKTLDPATIFLVSQGRPPAFLASLVDNVVIKNTDDLDLELTK